MIVNIIYKIIQTLSDDLKRKLFLLIFYTFIVNCFEVVTIYFLYPYLNFLLQGNLPDGHLGDIIQFILNCFGDNQVFTFTILYIFLVVISFFMKLFYLFISNKHIFSIGSFFIFNI